MGGHVTGDRHSASSRGADLAVRGPIQAVKAGVARRTAELARTAVELSHAIHADPELAFAEHHAASSVATVLGDNGFEVTTGVADLPTAFAARVGDGDLHLGLFAEYDALPDVGHACGHNLIAAVTTLAASVLAPLVGSLGVTLTVFGTPAEETGAGKILMLDRGVFDGLHAGLMAHPAPFDSPAPQTAATARLRVTAAGRSSHAGTAPYLGVNAADALALAQHAIALLRQHLPPGDQVHGVLTSAGSAANLVPAHAEADYVVRAPNAERRDALERRVRDCFAAGGLATAAKVTVDLAQPRMDELTSDTQLAARWLANASVAHASDRRVPPVAIATDLGTVSSQIPCIHPLFGIRSWPAVNHQAEFAVASVSPDADAAVVRAATALAWTVLDLATDPGQRARLRQRAERREDRTSDDHGVPAHRGAGETRQAGQGTESR